MDRKNLIFVIEDDKDISRLVVHHLENAGYGVTVFPDSRSVIPDAEKNHPVLFLLDIMLPGSDGLDLCRRIRENPRVGMIPVVFLTAKIAEADRIAGLELGADDYITKPFSPRELVARIRAVLRRFERPLPPSVLKIGDIEIDSGAMVLSVRGMPVPTTATEFRLLEFLARHAGRVFTRRQLLDAVWRDTAYVTERSIDVYIRRLREKIEANPEEPRLLLTIRGAGYRFERAI
jgi:two-component system phosphate regulon response regulator PhoB